jgi:hypothetical protein
MSVDVGQEIRTGPDGSVVLTRQDESVTIGSDSAFQPQPATDGMLTRIYQKIGTLLFKVQKRSNAHFEVQTPYLVAVVKGTTFTVNVDAAGGAVHVTEGLVEVVNASGADRMLVRPGKTASVNAARGSKLQIGTTPRAPKRKNGKQSKAPEIKRGLGTQSLNIEKASKGLFADPRNPRSTQTARGNAGGGGKDAGASGKALGRDKSLAGNLGNGLGLGLGAGNGNGNGNGGGNGNAGNNGNGNGNAGGQGNGNGNGKANGNGHGHGKN